MAKKGFTFKGIHSSLYGSARRVDMVARPPIKTYITEMPNRNGSIDFTGADGNYYFEDSIFTFELQIKAANIGQLRTITDNIGHWLFGKGTLIIDDDPTEYTASCYEGLNYQPQICGMVATIQVNFRVEPWWEATT